MTISYDDTRTKEFRLKLFPVSFDQTKAFYAEKLMYPILDEWNRGDSDRGVMFDTGVAVIELLTPSKGKVVGCNLSLEVADVWSLWGKLEGDPVVAYALKDNPWGDSSFGILDPDGFQITFFTQHINRKE